MVLNFTAIPYSLLRAAHVIDYTKDARIVHITPHMLYSNLTPFVLLQSEVETRYLIASRYNLSEGEDETQNYENSEFEGTQNELETDCDEPTASEDHKVVSQEISLEINVYLETLPAGTDRRTVNNQLNQFADRSRKRTLKQSSLDLLKEKRKE
ncbi:hypothetical protein FQR65_LT05812 [Abscondita terminalis]|nr:hypothetical protein FQR65_LT05812 [Abscondita terminalis]